MIAFEVSINGNVLALAGIRQLGVLSTTLTAGRCRATEDDFETYIELTVGGLTGDEPREFVRWLRRRELNPGDYVNVKILDLKPLRHGAITSQPIQSSRNGLTANTTNRSRNGTFELRGRFEPETLQNSTTSES